MDNMRLRLNPDIILGDIDGEIVALHLDSSHYLHLNSSGSFILSLFDAGASHSPAWLYGQVQRQYAVDAFTCRQEVDTFLSRCIELHLLCAVPEDPDPEDID